MRKNRRMYENLTRGFAQAQADYLDMERRRQGDVKARVEVLEAHASTHVHTDVMAGGSDTGVAYIP